MNPAEDLFNKTFFLTIGRWNMIHSLRQVGQAGLPFAARKVSSEYQEFVQEIMSDPDFAILIPAPLEPATNEFSVENLTTLLTTGAIDDFQKAVDFASLIFAHSIVDGAVFDYCRVTAIAAPQDWAHCVAKKEYTLKRIETAPFADLLREALDHFLSTLEKESLVKKLDFLSECPSLR